MSTYIYFYLAVLAALGASGAALRVAVMRKDHRATAVVAMCLLALTILVFDIVMSGVPR